MDSLKTSAVIVCLCCVVCSIVSLIIPTGRMKKTVSLVLGMFLLCSTIIPIKGLFDTFSKRDITSKDIIQSNENTIITENDFNESDYNKAVLKKTADNLVTIADNLLKNEGIKAENIKISLNVTDDNSIYIADIIIYITNEYKDKVQTIRKIIYSNMSKDAEIVIDENE